MAIAPMSGVTDEAFRLMFLKYGKPSVFWTEFVSAQGLFHSRGKVFCLKILEHSPKEKPIVAQLFGSAPSDFEKAASLMQELGFDGVDINMGCPDRAIEKQGAGAALIKNVNLAKEIIRATLRGAQGKQKRIPVSVKTRLGYNKIEIENWIKPILEEKIAVLTVHFRTKKELYFSKAHWEVAKEIVALRDKISPKTLLLGNGDVKSLLQAEKLIKETGLDGIIVGRAVVGDVWFFSGKKPSLQERLDVIVEHAELLSSLGGHFESMKKHFHAYTKGFRGAKELRENLMKVKNVEEVKKEIGNFLK